jgi:hypothetical protein
MPAQKSKDFLDRHNIKYVTMSHSLAYTAQEIAASAHIAGKDLAMVETIASNDPLRESKEIAILASLPKGAQQSRYIHARRS